MFSIVGAIVLGLAAGLLWWFARRARPAWAYRVVAAIAGAWLAAFAVTVLPLGRDPATWALALGMALFFAWEQPFAYVIIPLGAAVGGLLAWRTSPADVA